VNTEVDASGKLNEPKGELKVAVAAGVFTICRTTSPASL
jgi:hypothetical protein